MHIMSETEVNPKDQVTGSAGAIELVNFGVFY